MISFNFIISGVHPALAGHFPGHPVVPGVVIIDEITHQLSIIEPLIKIDGIPQVKFLIPLKPDTVVDVTIIKKNPFIYQFTCSSSEGVIANGQFRIQVEQDK